MDNSIFNPPSPSSSSSSGDTFTSMRLKLPVFPAKFVCHDQLDVSPSQQQVYYLFDTTGEMVPLHSLRLAPHLDCFQLFRSRSPISLHQISEFLGDAHNWATICSMMGSAEHIGPYAFVPSPLFHFTPLCFSNYFNLCISMHTSLVGVKGPHKPVYSIEDLIAIWFGIRPCSLLEAWCLVRTMIVVVAQDSVALRAFEERLRFAVAGVYPVDFSPEFYSRLSDIIITFHYYSGFIFSGFHDVGDFIQELLKKLLEVPALLANGLSAFITSLVASYMLRNVSCALKDVLMFMATPPAVCFIKTLIRYFLGYRWEQLVLEIFFEKDLVLWIDSRLEGFSIKLLAGAFSTRFQAEANTDEFIKFLIALVVGGLGVQYTHVSKLVSSMTSAATALDKFEFLKKINSLKDYILANDADAMELLRLRKVYPGTTHLISTYQIIVDAQMDRPASVAETRSILSYYASYLKEVHKFSKEESLFLRPMLVGPLRYISGLGASPLENCRREPKHFCFVGPPGLGKSTVVDRLIKALAASVKQDIIETAYHVNPSDTYASKYRFQDIWVFDELFQSADSLARPSIDVSLLYKLVTKSPIALNMAAVEEKGTIAACNLVLSCTNIPFGIDHDNTAQLKPYIKSVNSVEGIRRRLQYLVFPSLRPEYSLVNSVICMRDTGFPISEDQFDHSLIHEYRILGLDNKLVQMDDGAEVFSYHDLLYFISREYVVCRAFQPLDTVPSDVQHCYSDQVEVHDDSVFEVEGLFDFFTWRSAPKKGEAPICRCGKNYPHQVYAKASCYQYFGLVRDDSSRYMIDVPTDYPTGFEVLENDQSVIAGLLKDASGTPTYNGQPLVRFSTIGALEALEGRPFTPPYTTTGQVRPVPAVCVRFDNGTYLIVRFYTYGSYRVRHEEPPVEAPMRSFLLQVLLVSATLGVSAIIVKKLYDLKSRYSIHNGSIVYQAETGEIILEAARHPDRQITVNGQVWVRRFSKRTNKEEWYPQGLEAEVLDNHYYRQVPSICNSLYAIILKGSHVGSGFFIAEGTMITPSHVAHTFCTADLLELRRDDIVRQVLLSVGSDSAIKITPVEGVSDLSIVTFLRSAVGLLNIPNSRKHMSKISQSPPIGGAGKNYNRDATGRLITTSVDYSISETSEGYLVGDESIVHDRTVCRLVNVPSRPGWCGSLYLDESIPSSPIIGMHVAGNRNGRGLMVTLNTLKLKMFRVPISNQIAPDADSSMANIEASNLNEGFFEPESKKKKSRFHDRLSPCYGMSLVRPVTLEGRRIDPGFESLQRYTGITLSLNSRAISLRPAALALGQIMSQSYQALPLPTWEQTVSGGGEMASLDSSKSCGWPHSGVKQRFLTIDDEGRLAPTEELVEMCESAMLTLAPEDFDTIPLEDLGLVPSGVKCCVKEESIKLEKIMVKSRIFGASEIVEFLMQRRMFFDLCVNYVEKNLIFSSALGVAPEHYGIIHEHLTTVGPGGVVVAADFSEMDKHVTEEDILAALLMWFNMRGYVPADRTRVVDDAFPALSRSDFLRYRLCQRLANFIYVYRSKAFSFGKGHPSGSFLTSLLNNAIQDLTWNTAYAKALNVPVVDFIKESRRVFLGDDSLIALPAKYAHVDVRLVQRYMADLGYIVTGEVKTEPPRVQPLWDCQFLSDYTFLSRRFFKTASGHIIAPLEPDRCRKMLCFVDPKAELANMPQTFLSFADELERYTEIDEPRYRTLLAEGTAIIQDVFGTELLDLRKLTNLERVERYAAYTRRSSWVSEGGGGDTSTTTSLGANSSVAPTTFVEDVVTDTLTAQDAECESWRSAGMELENHAEGRVFARPFNFATYAWTTAGVGVVHTSYHPSAYFQANFNAQAKLANYSFFRGLLCIRAVMTSTPYTAGKLLMSVRPAIAPPTSVIVATGDPCVELDAASGKSAIIKIPCVMPFGWAQIESFSNTPTGTFDPEFDWCTFSLSVVAKLQDPALPTVTVNLYAWIEDVELKCPGLTTFTLAPQAFPNSANQNYESSKATSSSSRSSSSSGSVTALDHTPTPTEAGVISHAISAHKVVKTIGGILIDSAVMITQGMALAALIGLSDSSMMDNTTIVASIPHFDATHIYGKSPAQVLAADQSCKIVLPYGSFSIGTDCMDIAKYSSRMALLGKVDWTTVDLADTLLLLLPITPALASSFSIAVGTPNGYTPLAYAASMFRYWRGSIRYRFALSKTRFHAGILEIVWQMGMVNTVLNDDSHSTICYRAVWDIQESESFEITIPYISPLPWQPTWRGVFGLSVLPVVSARTSGVLEVFVVSPLLSSSDLATDTVSIVVYTAAGPDIEFAVPCATADILTTPPPAPEPSTKDVIDPKGKRKFYPEGGGNPGVFQEDRSKGLESVNPAFMMAPATPMSDIALTACIGEKIVNFRPLLRRFSRYTADTSATHAYRLRDLISTPGFISGHVVFTQMVGTFAFCTGGFRVAVRTDALIEANLRYLDLNLGGLPHTLSTPGVEHVYGVPYHHIVPFIYTRSIPTNTAYPLSLRLSVQLFGAGSYQVARSLATADDFSFGWQIGPDVSLFSPGVTMLDDIIGTAVPTYI